MPGRQPENALQHDGRHRSPADEGPGATGPKVTATPPEPRARLVERVEVDSIHLDGYAEQLKGSIREIRDDSEFKHDRCNGLLVRL